MTDAAPTLTCEQIESMPAGRELDALVAERLFGGVQVNPCWYWFRGGVAPEVPDFHIAEAVLAPLFAGPDFSIDIEAAWLVVDGLRKDGRQNMLNLNSTVKEGVWSWWCTLYPVTGGCVDGPYSETAPLAICRAALLSTLETEDGP